MLDWKKKLIVLPTLVYVLYTYVLGTCVVNCSCACCLESILFRKGTCRKKIRWIKFCLEFILLIFVFWTIRSLCFLPPPPILDFYHWFNIFMSLWSISQMEGSFFALYSLSSNLLLVFSDLDPFFFLILLQMMQNSEVRKKQDTFKIFITRK